jgi:tetratricopeptide (TPR) repeat protein
MTHAPDDLLTAAAAERRHGRPAAALEILLPHVEARLRDPDFWIVVGRAALDLGSLPQAGTAFERVVALRPDDRDGLIGAGQVLQARGLCADACNVWEHGAAAHPADPVLPSLLGVDLLRRGQWEAAECWLREALKRQPGHADALAGLGSICERTGRSAEGAALLDRWTAGPRPHGAVAAVHARCLLGDGQPEPALALLDRALAAGPDRGRSVQLHHARGDVLDRLGRHAEAFEAFAAANGLRTAAFDGPRHVAAVRQLIQVCSAEALDRAPRGPDTAPGPILVVGVPRSGTSLIEQMLGAHPRIAGVGERAFWRLQAVALARRWELPDGQAWYHHLDRLTPDLLAELGAAYRAELDDLAGGAPLACDKMPHNIFQLPLAALALPGTVVVHAVRDPLDTGWSCFRQNFTDGLAWSTRLESIAMYLHAERELMAHWQRVLPVPIVTVRYEELTGDPAAALGPVLAAVGETWDDSMDGFHQSGRYTATASYDQVRQPLYRHAVGRSGPYRPYLEPLAKVLEVLGTTDPAPQPLQMR